MIFADEEKDLYQASGGSEPAPPRDPASSLDEITLLLHRMLTLAELSSTDMPVDRELLQKMFERCKDKIDRIADTL